MEAVGENGGLDLSISKPLSDVSEGYTYFRDGDVVVAKITPCFENGKGAFARSLVNGIAFGTTELHVLRPTEGIDARFLFYLTLGQPFRGLGAATMYGAGGQKRVPEEFIRNLVHPIPRLAAQRVIAAFLDRKTAEIDALVAKKERLIELLEEKRTALITHAVTKGLEPGVAMKESGVEWLGKVPAHWTVTRVRDIAESLQTGPFGSQLHADEYVRDGVPVINPSHIRDGTLVPDSESSLDDATADRLARHNLLAGDIVFARRGELGRCGLVTSKEEGWICGTGSLRLRPTFEAVNSTFILHFLSIAAVREWLELQSVGSTMLNLNTAIIGRLPLAFPGRSEQGAIVKVITDGNERVDQLVGSVRAAIDRLKEYRSALITAAVTGQMQVPAPDQSPAAQAPEGWSRSLNRPRSHSKLGRIFE